MSILDDITAAKRRRLPDLRNAWPWSRLENDPLFRAPRISLAAALRRPLSSDGSAVAERPAGTDPADAARESLRSVGRNPALEALAAGLPGPGSNPASREARDGPPSRDPHSGIRFLCEIKRASPSAGEIRPGADAVAIAQAYRDAGAAGISLVTEEDFFRGRPDDLPRVREIGLPVLMKDFLFDPRQAAVGRALGADAVLLIAALGDRALLEEIRAAARELDLEVLVEIHDAGELDLAVALDPEMVGVNNRDLASFAVDVARSENLFPLLPREKVRLAESGLRNRADILRLEQRGFDACLVGESLMRASDPGDALRALSGRAAGPGAEPADRR